MVVALRANRVDLFIGQGRSRGGCQVGLADERACVVVAQCRQIERRRKPVQKRGGVALLVGQLPEPDRRGQHHAHIVMCLQGAAQPA